MKHIILLTLLFMPKLLFGIEICENKAAIDLEDIQEIQENGNILKYSYTYKDKVSYYTLSISDLTKQHLKHANPLNHNYIGEQDENGHYVFSIDCTSKAIIPHKKHKSIRNNNKTICTEKTSFKLIPISNQYAQILEKINAFKKLPIDMIKLVRQEFMKNHVDIGSKFTLDYFVALHLLAKNDPTAKSALQENNFFADNNPDYVFGLGKENQKIRFLLKKYSYKK
ncbi:MAG: hypothetical protein Q8S31_09390 [Alphaproteobacteria bacterium]|jgi:hypothetical protein|nr:hypothetical protein [Alphaproteobacteria bacterium]